MIRDTKQQWQPGQSVRVGFLALTVHAAAVLAKAQADARAAAEIDALLAA